MQSVGTDHEIERANLSGREADRDVRIRLRDAINRVAKDGFDAASDRAEDAGRQVAARKTDEPASHHPRERIGGETGDALSGGVHHSHFTDDVSVGEDLGREAHAPGDLEPGTPKLITYPPVRSEWACSTIVGMKAIRCSQ